MKRLVQSQIDLYCLEVVERVRQVVGVRERHAAALSVIEQRWLSGFDIVNGPERTRYCRVEGRRCTSLIPLR